MKRYYTFYYYIYSDEHTLLQRAIDNNKIKCSAEDTATLGGILKTKLRLTEEEYILVKLSTGIKLEDIDITVNDM